MRLIARVFTEQLGLSLNALAVRLTLRLKLLKKLGFSARSEVRLNRFLITDITALPPPAARAAPAANTGGQTTANIPAVMPPTTSRPT